MSERSTQRGVVFPSPVVVLSIIAVAMAAVAFFVTRGDDAPDKEVVAPSRSTTSDSPSARPTSEPTTAPKKKKKKKKPAVQRDKVYVEVYNNSGISGLAGSAGASATDAGWKVVGTDNWYGTVNGNTVFYPKQLESAAKQLALDLGIDRTAPAVGAMRLDRLTVILTGPL
ncbi:LytR C-terminal domain-containing protein [Nocardioides sp. GXZ039]|uniref:LytR C-terminal domain-containing protein n=1 Tax=Nocardioides sp. GXZ039 TaxID=3136018 RepID=UPI0030F3A7D5